MVKHCDLCITSCCIFAPWLHSFISVWMVSRQTSHSALCVCTPPLPPPLFCHFGGSKEKVAVKATPLPSLQPPRSIFKMRSDDTRAPGALLSRSMTVASFEGRKEPSHCDVKEGRETLLTAFKKSCSSCVCAQSDKYSLLHSSHAQVKQKEIVSNWSVSLSCIAFWLLI